MDPKFDNLSNRTAREHGDSSGYGEGWVAHVVLANAPMRLSKMGTSGYALAFRNVTLAMLVILGTVACSSSHGGDSELVPCDIGEGIQPVRYWSSISTCAPEPPEGEACVGLSQTWLTDEDGEPISWEGELDANRRLLRTVQDGMEFEYELECAPGVGWTGRVDMDDGGYRSAFGVVFEP